MGWDMNQTIGPKKVIDCRGENCPIVLLKIKDALKEMDVEDALEVMSTDPCAEYDVPNWSQMTGKELISAEHVTIYGIKKVQ